MFTTVKYAPHSAFDLIFLGPLPRIVARYRALGENSVHYKYVYAQPLAHGNDLRMQIFAFPPLFKKQ